MPWEVRAWWKLIWPPKLLSQDSPHSHTSILLCTRSHAPVPALSHSTSWSRHQNPKVCFSFHFLPFSATVTSSHHTICSSSLPCWAVSGLSNLTAELTSPSLVPRSVSAEVSDCSWHAPLSSATRSTPAKERKSTSSLPALICSISWCRALSVGLPQRSPAGWLEHVSRASWIEAAGCFHNSELNSLPLLLLTSLSWSLLVTNSF